jgi:hypothetical protein
MSIFITKVGICFFVYVVTEVKGKKRKGGMDKNN